MSGRAGADDGADPSRRTVGPPAGAAVGALAAVLALVPWLLTGAHLPPQVLGEVPVPPGGGPLALLPLSQDGVSTVLALVVTGSAAAGLAVRALRRAPRLLVAPGAAAGAGAGALAVHAVAAVQSVAVVAAGLPEGTASEVYRWALNALVVVSLLTGAVVLALITARARAAAVLGLAVAAVLLPSWLGLVLSPSGGTAGEVGYRLLVLVDRWLPAVLVGVVIAWAGLATAGRVAAACAALVLLWTGPALITAVSSAGGYRAAYRQPLELAGYGVQVLRAALTQVDVVVPSLLLAVVVAAAGLVAARARGRVRARTGARAERGAEARGAHRATG